MIKRENVKHYKHSTIFTLKCWKEMKYLISHDLAEKVSLHGTEQGSSNYPSLSMQAKNIHVELILLQNKINLVQTLYRLSLYSRCEQKLLCINITNCKNIIFFSMILHF